MYDPSDSFDSILGALFFSEWKKAHSTLPESKTMCSVRPMNHMCLIALVRTERALRMDWLSNLLYKQIGVELDRLLESQFLRSQVNLPNTNDTTS